MSCAICNVSFSAAEDIAKCKRGIDTALLNQHPRFFYNAGIREYDQKDKAALSHFNKTYDNHTLENHLEDVVYIRRSTIQGPPVAPTPRLAAADRPIDRPTRYHTITENGRTIINLTQEEEDEENGLVLHRADRREQAEVVPSAPAHYYFLITGLRCRFHPVLTSYIVTTTQNRQARMTRANENDPFEPDDGTGSAWSTVGAYSAWHLESRLVMHRQCWELLLVMDQEKIITPRKLWEGAFHRKSRFIDLSWIHGNNESDIVLLQQICATLYGKDCCIPVEVMERKVYERMAAWKGESLDGFPIQAAITKALISPLSDITPANQHASRQSSLLFQLPTEVIESIVMNVDSISTALDLTSTCKKMHAIVLPAINRYGHDIVARSSADKWILPLTAAEKKLWNETVHTLGMDRVGQIPWYYYAKMCHDPASDSMRNRKRVFDQINIILYALSSQGGPSS